MAPTSPSKRITVYEPTITGLPPLRQYVANVWSRRQLVWHLARTDMKAQHYDTTMGIVWLVVDPLLMAATFYLIRSVLGSSADPTRNSFLIAHLIMGVLFFYFVRDIVVGVANSMVANKVIILNTAAPRGAFPAVSVVRALFDLIPALIVYFFFHLIMRQPWGWSLVLLPLVIAGLGLFSVGLGLFFAPLVVFFKDFGTLLPYIVRIWMYITPVMFAVAEVPNSLRPVFLANPLYPFFAMLEEIFSGQMVSLGYVLAGLVWIAVSLTVGSVFFLLRERDYAVRL